MLNEQWRVFAKRAPFKEIGDRFGIDQVIARIIRNRDIMSYDEFDRYLNGTIRDLNSPHLLKRADEAAALIRKKIIDKKKIRVIGDYDIDGVNSTYILTVGIKKAGGIVDYDIPERMLDGYGLNSRLIEKAYADGVDTIVTCDNGIAASGAIQLAKDRGLTVIVTDHHEPQYEEKGEEKVWKLPPADILVDPKLPDDPYPFKEICGAVTAWKVVQILYEISGKEADAYLEFLPFAAFATVGDVMNLRDENRIIVREGLRALEETGNIGMRALIQACGLAEKRLEAYHIGFVLGPCINASGRLETALKALRLLMTSDRAEAQAIAAELQLLNEERKMLTVKGVEDAVIQIENEGMLHDKVLIVFLPGCHESVAGIIAGRIRERYNHPAIVMTNAQEQGMIKGSGRSIEGYEMFEELTKCADLLDHFGGHSMAAGLSMREDMLDAFRRKMNEQCELTDDAFDLKVMIDVPMPIGYITEELIEQLALIEPCGKGNEKPVFACKDMQLLSARKIGRNQNMLRLELEQEGRKMTALYFGDGEEMLAYLAEKYSQVQVDRLLLGRPSGMLLSAVYYPSINEFRGNISLQIIISHYN